MGIILTRIVDSGGGSGGGDDGDDDGTWVAMAWVRPLEVASWMS